MEAFLAGWLTVAVAALVVVASPGPNMAMILRNTLARSRRTGVHTAVGLALGDAVHVAYCLLGIAVVISQSIVLFNAIKWAGAAYLIFVGIKSLRAGRGSPGDSTASHNRLGPMGAGAAIRSGFLTSLLNPKVTLFFLALFTQVVQPDTPLTIKALFGLTVVCIELCWCALLAVLVSTGPIKSRFDAAAHWIERLTGAVLVALGLRLALSRVNS